MPFMGFNLDLKDHSLKINNKFLTSAIPSSPLIIVSIQTMTDIAVNCNVFLPSPANLRSL